MTLENLFDTAPRQVDVLGLPSRFFGEHTSRPAGYLVVGLHTRGFLDVSTYHVRGITALMRQDGSTRYHDNGVVHAILRGNFSVDAVRHRELCFPGIRSSDNVLQQLRVVRDCGYSFPYDFSVLGVNSAEGSTSVIVPDDQFVRDRHYRLEMTDYVRRTNKGALVLPCPTVYYATSPDEAQEAVRLLKQQELEFR